MQEFHIEIFEREIQCDYYSSKEIKHLAARRD